MKSLPIDPVIPEILRHLARATSLVLVAPPGAGKTTRVPVKLMDELAGDVLVLEPRRIAARMAARRVAAERGEKPGETVGYQVRLESVAGPATRLRYLTEGVLIRRLGSDPLLYGVSAVVLDEFHERHLETDVAITLLRRLQSAGRADLRLVVMSATIDSGPIAAYLGGAPVVRSEGRQHELSIGYTPHSADALDTLVSAALDRLIAGGLDGDVLVFLPGAAEIRRAMRTCAAAAARAGLDLVPLHGDLSPEEQDRAVATGARPKVILSTNVAESSITIEGVTAVIDSGLARVAEDSPWTGLPSLRVSRVSRASADQRAGRAGRLRRGRVIRLYPEEDYLRRVEQDAPEILRRELSQTCLDLHAMGIKRLTELQWLATPPDVAVEAAASLLRMLGAVDGSGQLTATGRRMAGLPVHPRLARMVVEAGRRGCGLDGCRLAALLSAGQRLPAASQDQTGPSDLLVLLEEKLTPRWRRLTAQIQRAAGVRSGAGAMDEELLQAVLTAFPDRVAARRRENELLLASGGSARQSPASVVRRERLLVAVDIEERREKGLPLVRLASGVKPEWLFDLYPDRISERTALEWNREAERVDAVSALLYDEVTIQESRHGAPTDEETARLLAEKAWETGLARFTDRKTLEPFLRRVRFAAGHSDVRALDEAALRKTLQDLCLGCRSFRELIAAAGSGGFLHALRRRLSNEELCLVEDVAPERIRLPGGRRIRIEYEENKPPWAKSRLQDFFGMRDSPRVGRDAVPVVLHLLAPNMRPVQTTTDLAGFWERLYPQVRRELRRRYPKHAWPEKPV